MPQLSTKSKPKKGECLYGTDGRCEHMIDPVAVAKLKHAFNWMQANKPGVMAKHKASNFDEELRRLAIRYRPVPGTKASEVKHWSIPQRLKTVIMQTAKLTKERFSSPLTAHPCSKAYWAAHERDEVFGANHDAYSSRWTGGSLAVPELEVHEATKALDWAIRSAKSTTASTLTLLILPTFYANEGVDAEDDPRFMQLLRRNHDVCLPVCKFGWESLQFEPPGCQPLVEPRKLRRKFMLIAVGNQEGYAHHFPFVEDAVGTEFYSEFKAAVRDALPEDTRVTFETIGDIRLTQDNTTDDSSRWARKASKRFRKRHADSAEERTLPRHPLYTYQCRHECLTPDPTWLNPGVDNLSYEKILEGHQQAVAALSKETPPSPPLTHNWREFLYTDGSHVKGPECVGPGIGAAVHIPGEDTIAVHCAWEGEGADAKCNTICRAELAALNVALTNYGETHKRSDNTLHVATDSLASMYGLAKMITRPQDLREHRHRTILESLAQAVRDHTGTIHLWKVKSHTGIVGNELADQTAVLMAKGEIPEEKYHLYTTPSNNRENMGGRFVTSGYFHRWAEYALALYHDRKRIQWSAATCHHPPPRHEGCTQTTGPHPHKIWECIPRRHLRKGLVCNCRQNTPLSQPCLYDQHKSERPHP